MARHRRSKEMGVPAGVFGAARLPAEALDLGRDFKPFARGSQGEIFQSASDPNILVKKFTLQGVAEAHLRELVRLNGELAREGLPVPEMEVVRLLDASFGIKMRRVKGEPLGRLIDRLNPRDMLTNPEAIRLQDEAFEILRRIDERTGKLADTRGLLEEVEDFGNFLAVRDGQGGYRIVNIDPINMARLMERLPAPERRAVQPGAPPGGHSPSSSPVGRATAALRDPRGQAGGKKHGTVSGAPPPAPPSPRDRR